MRPVLTLLAGVGARNANDARSTVLVAEPDRLRGALIAADLEDLGVEVVWVAHPDSALLAAEERSFDLHVADPSLRTAQGEHLVEALVTEHPCVPLVATGSSTAVIHLASTRLPAADVVALVRAALERRRHAEERQAPASEGARPPWAAPTSSDTSA